MSETEQLEFSKLLNRGMRQGSFAALNVSDWDRVREAIQNKDAKKARAYIEILRTIYDGLIMMGTEWDFAWVNSLAKRVSLADERKATKAACDRIREIALGSTDMGRDPEVKNVAAFYTADTFEPTRLEPYQKSIMANQPTLATEIMKVPHQHYESLMKHLEVGDFSQAAKEFETYGRQMRLRHDFVIQFIATYPATINKFFGQKMAEEVLHESFSTGMFYEGLWTLMFQMSSKQVAVFLAEHVRAHFSGPNRDGQVRIVEEEDRFRLIFEPCGSGQVMRLRAEAMSKAGVETLPAASPYTWGRKNEVPAYCSHCAVNELESMRRLGFPLFITEFNPDPHKPCGWVIYKDPKKIPAQYFERLGYQRDPAKFQSRQ